MRGRMERERRETVTDTSAFEAGRGVFKSDLKR
jgi:hypothetical protein